MGCIRIKGCEDEKMQKMCCNCFGLYEDISGMCPHCGYVCGEPAEMAYYLKPGTRLKRQRYAVGKVAGQGGFGIVYKAWDFTLQRIVAIKEFFPTKMVTRTEGECQVVVFSSKRENEFEMQIARFRHEAQIMSMFSDSPNSIDTYDVFDENGTSYIVMEYIDSPTLKAVMKERGGQPLPEREAIDYASQMLNVLGEMHSKGVYHLDVALDNIFVRVKNGKKELIFYDFGAARTERKNKKVAEDDLIVKPGFAPPEQYKKNGKIGAWTDIYAVGANLYYLLTGVIPVESTDREHEDILEEPSRIEIISPAINNVVMRAMALNPELRYESAKEFKKDLTKEKVISLQEELRRRKRARNSFVGICSMLILVAVLALGYFGVTNGKIRECEITVWIVEEVDQDAERMRYQAVIDAFREFYPQITINLKVIKNSELETDFFRAEQGARPDLIETTYASQELLEQCSALTDVLNHNKDLFIADISEQILSWNKKCIPLGMYVDVIYKQSGAELKDLSEVAINEFLKTATGYAKNDTTVYEIVQKSVAGRYEITESDEKQITFVDVFSVSARDFNKKKAAKALLAYMLSDSAQEMLHISYHSDFLPVTENDFQLYVGEVFREMDFLQDTIGSYIIKGR